MSITWAGAGLLLLPALALAQGTPCGGRSNNTTEKLTECVTLEGVRAHQAALQAIADANNGHRVAGSSGEADTADYVAGQLQAAGYAVTRQSFQFQTFYTNQPTLLEQVAPGPVGPLENSVLSYSGSGDVTAPVTALAAPPTDGTPGCEAADFAGFPAGNIALIRRGVCTFAIKATNAFNAGASGVVIYNNSSGVISGTLGNGFTLNIPVTAVTQAVGEQLAATPGLQLRLRVDAFRGIATSQNVIAESALGDPDNVVMAGASFDSVNAGPGINFNGSGTAVLLETAIQMARVEPVNKLRFAFWGASRAGRVGSTNYVTSLAATDLAKIALYLDFWGVGSPNHVYFVYDGDDSDGVGAPAGPAGTAAIEQGFLAYYDAMGVPVKGADLTGLSDYGTFYILGIPTGGIFTGAQDIKTPAEAAIWGGTAGQQYDPCFQLACDTFSNVNLAALDFNADVTAYATLRYAMSTVDVNGVEGKGNAGKIRKVKMPKTTSTLAVR
jgi:aminopeptidase Y